MDAAATLCPQCGAPVTPASRFAREATCGFCRTLVRLDPSIVRAAPYQAALLRWERPTEGAIRLESGWWTLRAPLARGSRTDLWHVERARTPTERGILKLSRDESSTSEADVLELLARSGSPVIGSLIPAIIASGPVTEGPHAGKRAVIVRAAPTFAADLTAVRRVASGGIDPASTIWMWRRILEILRILVECGISYHAVEPAHFVAERNQHGLRLVGFGNARLETGGVGRAVCASARMLRELSAPPPDALAELWAHVEADPSIGRSAAGILDLHRRVGDLAKTAFGPPHFRPLPLPA